MEKCAFALMVTILFALGVKFVAGGLQASYKSVGAGVVRLAIALMFFVIAMPILLFLVLDFAKPSPN